MSTKIQNPALPRLLRHPKPLCTQGCGTSPRHPSPRGAAAPLSPPKGGLFWLLAAQSRQILPRANPICAAAWLPRAKKGHKGVEKKLQGLPAEGRRPDERHGARDNVLTPPTGRPRSGIYQNPACLQEHGTAPASSLAPCPESPRLCSSSSRTSLRGALPSRGCVCSSIPWKRAPKFPPARLPSPSPAARSQRPT